MPEHRGATRRAWVKLWVTGWLHGSIRYQLTPDERGVWADLLAWAGECEQGGAIMDNSEKPFPMEYMANHLNIPLELLTRTLDKSKEEGRIKIENGIIFITSWKTYQSEYERQKAYRIKDKDQNPDKFTQGRYGHMVQRGPDDGTDDK